MPTLVGPWKGGWALDQHFLTYNKRTEIGELIYQLKYKQNKNKIKPLVDKLYDFMKTRYVTSWLYAIIPVPPSNTQREFQPVFELADSLGNKLKIKVYKNYLIKTKDTSTVKNISVDEKKKILSGVFKVKNNAMENKKVLLFDDIYQSGSTLGEITKVLKSDGLVENVYALTITKTKTKDGII